MALKSTTQLQLLTHGHFTLFVNFLISVLFIDDAQLAYLNNH